jgi:hypothetical protein
VLLEYVAERASSCERAEKEVLPTLANFKLIFMGYGSLSKDKRLEKITTQNMGLAVDIGLCDHRT